LSDEITVTISIPTEVYELLEEKAAPIEDELIRCARYGLIAQQLSKTKRGRPPKHSLVKMYDTLLDYLVLREVSRRPKGKISETIKHLKKREPFKSAGDLRSRYNRLAKELRAKGHAAWPGDEWKVVLESPKGPTTVPLHNLDQAFQMVSHFKGLGDADLSGAVGREIVEAGLRSLRADEAAMVTAIAELEAERAELEARIAELEIENVGLEIENAELEARIRGLEVKGDKTDAVELEL
jgi:hypothetical protein